MQRPTGVLWLALVGALSCSQEHQPSERADAGAETADGQAVMAPGEAGSAGAPLDAGVSEPDAEGLGPSDTGSSSESDAPSNVDASDASRPPDTQCDPRLLEATRIVPEVMIVLDRSQSMAPTVPAGVSCLNVDIVSVSLLCQSGDQAACDLTSCVSVDCNAPPFQGSVVCGGTNPSPSIDRWQPAVQGLESVTEQFQTEMDFGLTIFPGQTAGTGGGDDLCAAGNVRVPIAPNAAGPIAQVLDATAPGGATPLGSTLTAVLEHLQARPGPSRPRSLLLLTDGQPTCPYARGITTDQQALAQDHALALQALDALRAANVRTFVLGFVAPSETALAAALGEFATHGGTDHFYPVQDAQSIIDHFAQVAASVVIPCSVTLEAEPEAHSLSVQLDASTIEPDTEDGWTLQGAQLTLQGAACEMFSDGSPHRLKITQGCEPR